MSTLYWSLGEAARWLKNTWHWPESGTVPPPDVCFCHGRSGNEENIKESWVILVTSHIVLTWTWRITTPMRSAECVGFCQHLCLVVRVDLMFVTAGKNPTLLTNFDEKGYLRKTYFCKQCLSLIGGIKEFEIIVAEFVSAINSSSLVHTSALATGVSGNDMKRTSLLIPLSITTTKTPFSSHIMLWHWKSIFQVPF